jgi:hypothetical protein
MFSLFLPNFSSMLLHSSGFVYKDRSALFLAPDEGGKTTAVRLLPSDTIILSDDQVLIKKTENGFVATGSPWGLHSSRIEAPINRCFILKKSNEFHLIPSTPLDLNLYLMLEHQDQLILLPQSLKESMVKFINSFSNFVSVWELYFPKEFIDWNAVSRLV